MAVNRDFKWIKKLEKDFRNNPPKVKKRPKPKPLKLEHPALDLILHKKLQREFLRSTKKPTGLE